MTDMEKTTQVLHRALGNISNSIIDNYIQKNVEFRAESGLSEKIIRTSSGHCCEWCDKMAGTYMYPDVPKDVYRRHDNCDCTVEYVDGKVRQNVWSKKKIEINNNFANVRDGFDTRKMITHNIEDVLWKYINNANPNVGNIVIQDGTKEYDINMTKWIFETFGGDIKCIVENSKIGKLPDALWNGIYWEYKEPKSVKAIEDRIKKGLIQIAETLKRENNVNADRGLVIDISKIEEKEDALDKIRREINARCHHKTDIIVYDNKKIIAIYRIHK